MGPAGSARRALASPEARASAAARFPGRRGVGIAGRVLRGIEESFSAFGAECAELISAQPGVVRGGFDARASPLDHTLLASLARWRVASSLSTTSALGCPLSSLAHPGAVLALLAAQRDAGAEALRHLAELRRRGTPGANALATILGASSRDIFLCDAVLFSRISVEDYPSAIAIGLFPYGPCMAQLVEGLEEVADAASDVRPCPLLSRGARDGLDAIQHAYPLELGDAVRANSPGCSASGFKDALADADRGCADGIASIMRGSASGSPRVADLLGRLSCRPGAPDAVLAAAAAASRRTNEVAGGGVGVAAGVFSHGSALRQLASEAARAGASAASSARRRRAAGHNTTLATRFWVDTAWGRRPADPRLAPPSPPPARRVAAGGPSHAPLRRPIPPTEMFSDEGPALGWARAASEEDRPALRAAPPPAALAPRSHPLLERAVR